MSAKNRITILMLFVFLLLSVHSLAIGNVTARSRDDDTDRDQTLPLPGMSKGKLSSEIIQPSSEEGHTKNSFVFDQIPDMDDFNNLSEGGLSLNEREQLLLDHGAVEIKDSRNTFARHYHLSNGQNAALISRSPMNYLDSSNQWRKIQTEIIENPDGTEDFFPYAVIDSHFQTYFSEEFGQGYLVRLSEGEIKLGTRYEILFVDGNEEMLGSVSPNSSTGSIVSNQITFDATFPFGYNELVENLQGIENNLVLTETPESIIADDDIETIVIRQFINLPDGWSIMPENEFDGFPCEDTLSKGRLIILDENDSYIAEFTTPIMREGTPREIYHEDSEKGAYAQYETETTKGTHRVQRDGNGFYVESAFSAQWLRVEDRTFPAEINSTIYVYPEETAGWTGYSLSSSECYCGNSYCGDYVVWQGDDVYKGWMYFDTTSIPDGSDITDVDLHFYVWNVNWPYYYVRRLDTFTIYCSSLWTYLNSSTIYVNSTNDFSTGWRSHDLGTTADADLESRLSSDYFGVGFDDYDSSESYYAYAHGYYYNDPYLYITYSTSSEPNLEPATPSGWDYPIVPSSVSGTNTVNTLYGGDDTYIDFVFLNDSDVNITDTFYSCLYLDGSQVHCWYWDGLLANYYGFYEDYILDPPVPESGGWHNLEMVYDVYNDVTESNESDNSWNMDFYWEPATTEPDIRVEPSSLSFTEERTAGGDEMASGMNPATPQNYLFMKNPASVYCKQLGYESHVITAEDGSQRNFCDFPDGTSCDGWDFYGGTCGEVFSYCAKQGLNTISEDDGQNPYSPVYAVCTDESGAEIGSASDLMDLEELMGGNYLLDLFGPVQGPPEPPSDDQVDANPTSFDWRNYDGGDWTTSVKDQHNCGSCWAFSAVGVSEAAFNIAANNPDLDLDLSEEYLVTDCALDEGACDGGSKDAALAFIRDEGIPDEACLPYGDFDCTYDSGGCIASTCNYSTDGECSDYQCSDRCSDWADRLYMIDSYTYLGYYSAVDTMRTALIAHGPLAVSMNMDGSFNSSGIYTCSDNTSTGHAVIVVGYNDTGSYWIVKNSWGDSWGYDGNGFFKVAYDNCAIQKYPYYADASPLSGLMIFNDGSGDLEVSSISVVGGSCWLTVIPDLTVPATISPSGSMGVDVTVDASCVSSGTYNDTIRINSNDPDENPLDVPVSLEVIGNDYTLSVSKAGTGDGTVTSDPAGINCGTDCSEIYAENTIVSLTPDPDLGSTFSGWSGDSDCTDGVVTMTAERNCTATFNLIVDNLVGGTVNLQSRTDHSGAEVCADDGGTPICTFTDASGYYELSLPDGTYTIRVEMERYLDAVKTGYAVSSDVTLPDLTLPGGDTNDDDTINILDLSLMGARYELSCGDIDWDARADINDDCTVNILDLSVTGGNYEESSPVPWF